MFRAAAGRWFETQWQRLSAWHALLIPLAWLFGALAALRRALFRVGLLSRTRLPVPVVVVGDVTVGGSGKTPLVLWLVQLLQDSGFRPGVISRGYGAAIRAPRAVDPASDAREVGDEPLLLAQRGGAPVWVGRDRVAAARALLRTHAACDILVADDGLQHYALARDVECVVVDGARAFGNGRLLPAGPLREPLNRLRAVDAVVVNGDGPGFETSRAHSDRVFTMQLQAADLYLLRDSSRCAAAESFAGKRVHAVAGIGNPARFFAQLRAFGWYIVEHAFPDHHAYAPSDLSFGDDAPIVMTEKDAVKCAGFATGAMWVFRVVAQPEAALAEHILARLRKAHGRTST